MALIAVVVIVFIATRPGNPTPVPTPSGVTAQELLTQLSSVPTSNLDQVGLGTANPSKFGAITGQPPLTTAGKPEVLYLGAEYCPFCAAERWGLIVALGQFGTLTNAGFMTSSATDRPYASVPTWTFHGSQYSSPSLAFVAVEAADNQGRPLESMTAQQQVLGQTYGGGTIPFIDFGNKLYLHGATYLPDPLMGLGWQQIASDIQDPSTPQAKAILGSANLITAAICRATGDQPASVCSDPVIQKIGADDLPKS